MKDIISCFSENAVNVSHSSCSSYPSNACISQSSVRSLKSAVTCVYKVILSTGKQLLVRATWSKNQTSQGLVISFGDDDPSACFKLNTNSKFFGKKKGSKVTESGRSKIEVIWDLSTAEYDVGPEPINGFYVVVMVNSEMGLVLGHVGEETITKKLKTSTTKVAKSCLVSRQEHCSGNTHYSTKARFRDTGILHDVSIRCSGEHQGLKHLVLSVCIDKKTVIHVKRLLWNFRGNQTIFVDGLLIDLMWDVHDWFFKPVTGSAVFMFRTRRGLDSRLWLEEMLSQNEHDRVEFSLLIYACKNT
ncbi:Phosphoglycerate/bisphosphoglycerate mutase family protein isoform 1 [Hibiscus syriacus]|uniref:Phosphoglycerate/bisphosphoglycerate mutase family protein isoform 1 n=1 Tax=Hibiscus syriacus TaxID=106335 RepID=A0A6A2ZZN2_HIBSY|nr:uncharacterized protein LOC120136642 [Hibiscus syriacus]KAE8697036.1 Phosphoglycerate/bisphosphoglycerate mutase family protein isoform 1 [Hibiscus syriacus]